MTRPKEQDLPEDNSETKNALHVTKGVFFIPFNRIPLAGTGATAVTSGRGVRVPQRTQLFAQAEAEVRRRTEHENRN